MRYYQAQDTFVAVLGDGTERTVNKGDPLPENHELVKRDIAAGTKDRMPLFRLLDHSGGEEPARKPAARKAAGGG